jgi:hypothetical protein
VPEVDLLLRPAAATVVMQVVIADQPQEKEGAKVQGKGEHRNLEKEKAWAEQGEPFLILRTSR